MEYWIWLSRIEGLGPIKIKELLKQYKTPENIWELDKKKLMQTKGIGENIANSILKKEYRENLEQYVKYMKKYNIGIITIEDKDYPKKLLHIYDAPAILYYKGDKKLLHTDIIAMIGCRECSNYGKEVSIKFSYELAKKGITIITVSYTHLTLPTI